MLYDNSLFFVGVAAGIKSFSLSMFSNLNKQKGSFEGKSFEFRINLSVIFFIRGSIYLLLLLFIFYLHNMLWANFSINAEQVSNNFVDTHNIVQTHTFIRCFILLFLQIPTMHIYFFCLPLMQTCLYPQNYLRDLVASYQSVYVWGTGKVKSLGTCKSG